MKKCESCGVEVRALRRCPLCQGVLVNDGELQKRTFPSYLLTRRKLMLWRIIAMCILFVSAVSVIIYMMNPTPLMKNVMGYTIGGGACILIEMMIGLQMRGSLARIIGDQACIISIACIIWDWATGWHGWSTQYVLPLVLLCALVIVQILRFALKTIASDYVIRIVGMSIICIFVPQLVSKGWAGAACSIAGVASLLELFFLESNKTLAELARRFHV